MATITKFRGQPRVNWAGSVGIKLGQTGLQALTTIVMARLLGPQEYGVYAYVLAISALLSIPTQKGLVNLVIRNVARCRDGSDRSYPAGLILSGYLGIAVYGLALLVLLPIVMPIIKEIPALTDERCLVVGILMVTAVGMLAHVCAVLRSEGRVLMGQWPDQIFRPVLVIVGVVGGWFAFPLNRPDALYALSVQLCAAVVAYAVARWIATYHTDTRLWAGERRYALNMWLKSVVPFMAIGGLQVLVLQTDILMLGAMSQAPDVGKYRVGMQAAIVVTLGLQAANMVLGPLVARETHDGNWTSLRRSYGVATLWASIFALGVCAFYGAWGELMLSWIVGKQYLAIYPAMMILTVGYVVSATVGSAGMALNMSGNENSTLKAMIIGVTTNVILNMWAIPIWGANGAAGATAFSVVVVNLLLARSLFRRLGIVPCPLGNVAPKKN